MIGIQEFWLVTQYTQYKPSGSLTAKDIDGTSIWVCLKVEDSKEMLEHMIKNTPRKHATSLGYNPFLENKSCRIVGPILSNSDYGWWFIVPNKQKQQHGNPSETVTCIRSICRLVHSIYLLVISAPWPRYAVSTTIRYGHPMPGIPCWKGIVGAFFFGDADIPMTGP